MHSPDAFKGWYSRGYLPHFDTGHAIQSLTFRLADSLPRDKLRQLEEALAHRQKADADRERRKTIEKWLDAGSGSCLLGHPEIAQLVQDALLGFDGQRYHIIAWCIMPNHVHVLLEPMVPLSSIVRSWKSFTSRKGHGIAKVLGLDAPAPGFWMREYWDRFIRNEEHLMQVVEYIHQNPVKADLCHTPEAWPWSSAAWWTQNPWARNPVAPSSSSAHKAPPSEGHP